MSERSSTGIGAAASRLWEELKTRGLTTTVGVSVSGGSNMLVVYVDHPALCLTWNLIPTNWEGWPVDVKKREIAP